MNVRELIEILGAGDLDREVWVAVPRRSGLDYRALRTVEDLTLLQETVCVLEGEKPSRPQGGGMANEEVTA
jgi:hypothetical protein